ncbi:COBRA-like protein 1 isoform X2 [Iris pallida]|uniref:COBRA-like protein 1 isoform X2 n=1 Tax=Iris pallida TaxID=29817 RepID=A0AAX6DWU6_IRIPA|nr:COBRA-like protein 1 isoform X2 [Iris pallida]
MSWTPDGYVAVVTIFNYQRFRHIEAPGWTLGWTWAKEEELIWATVGARTKERGDCSRFKGNIPASCKKDPQVVDLPRKAPYSMQVANCCRGGVISTGIQDPANSASSFQLSVGRSGTTNRTVLLPKHFTLTAPGAGYACGAAKVVRPTRFVSPDGRRMTQVLIEALTWNVTCTSTQFLVRKTPTCCVALSAFYNEAVADCPLCACGCHTRPAQPGRGCAEKDESGFAPSVQCTPHMCPIRVHWHVEHDIRKYWRVQVTVTNFDYRKNYSEWNLGVQHPNFNNNLARAFGLNYKSLPDDTAMLWGIKRYNGLLREAGRFGHVQGELLFRKKGPSTFALQKGWAFARRVYFNGDSCVMPPPDAYPQLTNSV